MREIVARSSPAGDQCVASSSSRIRRPFRKSDRFDNAGHCRLVAATQTDGSSGLRRVAERISCSLFASARSRLGGVIGSEEWRVNRFDYHGGTLSNYGSAF
jgi:hypothetical protein